MPVNQDQANILQPVQEEISLLDLFRILYKRKWIVLSSVAVVTAAASIFVMLQPNVYTATATILPVENSSSNNLSSVLASMGGGVSLLASQAGIGDSGSADKFVTIMRTRTLAENVINKQNLMPRLFPEPGKSFFSLSSKKSPSLQEGVEELKSKVSLKSDKKNGTVNVSVTTQDPELAARIANAYVAELEIFLKNSALTTAKRNRLFVEEQLSTTQKEMATYEVAMKNFQQKNKVVALDAQTEASVKAYADLKAKLITSEIELGLLEKATFEGDPQASLKRHEVNELKRQLSKLEGGGESGPIVSFQQAPSLGLDYARLKRELLVRGKVFELLTQQFELAKIEEAKEDISLQVLDSAIPPEKKSSPKRLMTILLALFGSGMLGSLLAFITEYWTVHKDAILNAKA